MRGVQVRSQQVQPRRVVIVGGGASGVIVAARLLRQATADQPVDVQIIERDQQFGPGLPYRTPHPLHTLNNYAGRMSALDDEPDHLVRWATAQGLDVSSQSFVTRDTYGRYLTDVLDSTEVPEGSSLRRVRGEVVDVVRRDGELEVVLAEVWTIPADDVVLCLGTPPPARLGSFEVLGDRYLADPWGPQVEERLRAAKSVLLVGTGLTMIDLAAQAHRANPDVELVAISRSEELPRAHGPRRLRALDDYRPQGDSLAALLADVRAKLAAAEAAGEDWRDVIETIRSQANDLWHGLDAAEQEEFVRSLARSWEVRRHRMSREMAALIGRLIDEGTLRIAQPDHVSPVGFDVVVNCTGLGPVCGRGWSTLVDRLLDEGIIRPHWLGLGLDLGADGQVIDAAGELVPGLYAVGAARKGVDWEATAVPDLRRQATGVVGRVLQEEAGEHEQHEQHEQRERRTARLPA